MARTTSTRALTGALGAALMISVTNCGSAGQQPEGTFTATATPEAWSEPLGGTSTVLAGVAVAGDGSARVAGTLDALATIGASVLAPAGGTDVLIAKLGSSGEVLWAHDYGDAANQSASAVAVDAQGDTLVVGTFAGTLDFSAANAQVIQSALIQDAGSGVPAPPLTAQGSTDGFVAKLDPEGALLWATPIGAAGATTEARSVAVSPDGRVVVAGSYVGPAVLSLPRSSTTSAFVVALDGAGGVMWATSPGGQEAIGTSIALDAQDDVFLAGTSALPPVAAGQRLAGDAVPASVSAFVTKLTAAGSIAWSQSIGDMSSDGAIGLAADSSGDALLLANYGVLTPGATERPLVVGPQMHLVKYDPQGNVLWDNMYGSPDGGVAGDALAVDVTGNAYVAGHAGEALSFGQCTVSPSAGDGSAAFIGRVEPDGTATCAMTYGTGGTTRIHALSAAQPTYVVMTGTFTGTLDVGQGSMQSSSPTAFVAQEDATLEPLQ